MATIYGVDVQPEVDSIVQPDNWPLSQRLLPSDWEAAQFRITTDQVVIPSLAVNIKVTGRTWQRRQGNYWVRVQIEFVGDGEPSTFHTGWMLRK